MNDRVDSWSEFLLQPYWNFYDDTLDGLLNISSEFGQNHNFPFLAIVLYCNLHLVFVVATTNQSFYCFYFEWPAIWHDDRLQNWLDFGHHLFVFLILIAFWLHLRQVKFATLRHFLENAREEGRNGMTFGTTYGACWQLLHMLSFQMGICVPLNLYVLIFLEKT